jgi:hypothetical protein
VTVSCPAATADATKVSDSPQLVETESAMLDPAAAKKASMNPGSVLGAWYTSTLAPGASAPDCSMSRSVSPVPALSLGAPEPPSTFCTVSVRPVAGTWATFCQKYCGAPGSTEARVTMPSVFPDPLARTGRSSRRSWTAGSRPACPA